MYPQPGARLHGLGLVTDNSTTRPGPHGPRSADDVIPLSSSFFRPQHPSQGALRRFGSVDDVSLSLPERSSSLKNRKSRRVRPASLDSPTLPQIGDLEIGQASRNETDIPFLPRDLDQYPHGATPLLPFNFDKSIDDRIRLPVPFRVDKPLNDNGSPAVSHRPILDRSLTSFHTAQGSLSDYGEEQSIPDGVHSYNTSMSSQSSYKPSPLSRQLDGQSYSTVREPNDAFELATLHSTSTTPSREISSVTGWRQNLRADDASTPRPTVTNGNQEALVMSSSSNMEISNHPPPRPPPADLGTFNNTEDDYPSSREPSPPPYDPSELRRLVEELREELRSISIELAGSIQREMDLEDEVDRLKTEIPIVSVEENRRTSDYYSESGSSLMRMPVTSSETKIEGLEKMRRKAEQERARLRHEMAQKFEEDIIQRRALEMHCQSLEEQLRVRDSVDFDAHASSQNARELELSLDDTRRRLLEERQVKQNIEELLTGMRAESETHRNERDNLRDEIVPQLRARVEGLEVETADMQKLIYENTRMQQELHSLRNENQALVEARKMMDMQQQNQRFRPITEDEAPPLPQPSPLIGLSRSKSLARTKGVTRRRSTSISKVNGMPEQPSVELPGEHIKDVEDQRDALQQTLKALIMRQNYLARQHAKQIRALETEKTKALSGTPRRAAFNIEVQQLRSEIDHLRRRADDALEQKWQCEKGLSGLKMDLDRAQQETASLRELLHDNTHSTDGQSLVTDSLDKASADLRSMHADSIATIQTIDDGRAEALLQTDQRMTSLFLEIEARLQSNADLRQRLRDAIVRGVHEQQASAQRITDLQTALRAAEERLTAAQAVSEDAVAKQEDLIRDLSAARNETEKRGLTRTPSTAPTRRASTLPLPSRRSSMRIDEVSPRPIQHGFVSPKLVRMMSGVAERSRAEVLAKRVRELEEEAGAAEREIKGVVEKLNGAQIDVAMLQGERDEAMRQTRRLQREILAERERLKALAVA